MICSIVHPHQEKRPHSFGFTVVSAESLPVPPAFISLPQSVLPNGWLHNWCTVCHQVVPACTAFPNDAMKVQYSGLQLENPPIKLINIGVLALSTGSSAKKAKVDKNRAK